MVGSNFASFSADPTTALGGGFGGVTFFGGSSSSESEAKPSLVRIP